ncbi:hypothetical protein SAMN04489712_109196 [Thermomonospora echinospora]|uniref:Uncharacterized protein n=1 Tax=Thermomonospora echinospora TaxID=1992 RepID=A0A1H6CCX7_9ACTN|nr:hypothetical protein [Thermomonospora echinospora]SEG70722.1 hypothetical protein SAMN04489712_109196 [Thermomonospora echinospora]
MTEESPRQVLDEVERLGRLTRARAHGAAVPFAVFGLLTLLSAVLYESPFGWSAPIGEIGGGGAYSLIPDWTASGYAGLEGNDRSAAVSIAFWLIVGPLCYLGCAWWYRERAERVGLAMRWRPWVIVGLALLVMMLLGVYLRGLPGGPLPASPQNVIGPLPAVALGLLVLAWAERSRGLAASALVYGTLSTMMNVYGLGQIPGGTIDPLTWPGNNLVLLAAVLLVGALASHLHTSARLRAATVQPA